MEISGTNIGASTYAMKKAMEMPNLLIGLVQQTADSGKNSLEMKSPLGSEALDLSSTTGTGAIIDITA